MLATIAFVSGILLAIFILAISRRKEVEGVGSAGKPTRLGWCTLVFGLLAVTALGVATQLSPQPNNSGLPFFLTSITFAFAAVVAGAGSLVRRDRAWPTWVGFVAGLIPAIFWIVFALGNIFASGG
jgi:hypothetical protein